MIGLCVSVFIMMTGVGTIMPLLPGKIVHLGASGHTVAYIASAFALPYILLQIPMGALSDKLGVKRFLVCGYLLCALSGVVYYYASSPAMILIGRVVQGSGEAPLWALAPALLSILYAREKGKAIGIYNATLHVGLTIGPLLGILLLRHGFGDLNFLFFSSCCTISALVVGFSVKDVNRKTGVPSDAPPPTGETVAVKFNFSMISSLIRDRKILAVFLGIMLYGASYGLFLTTLPAFMLNAKGFSQTFVQLFFAVYYLAVSLSQILTGPLCDKYGTEKFMLAGIGTLALLIGFIPLFQSQVVTLAVSLFASIGLGMFFLSSMSFLNSTVSKDLKGTISGTYYLFWGIGFFLGPVVVGRTMSYLGDNIGLALFAAALMLETAALAFVLLRKKPHARR